MFQLNDHDPVLLRLKQRTERKKQRYVKITALLMLDAGFSAAETAAALRIDEATVYRYRSSFCESDSVEAYLQLHYRGSSPRLSDEQLEILLEELTTTLHRSAASVAAFIRQRFTISYAERGVRHLLQRLGFRFNKARLVPAKADPQAQRRFLRYRLLRLLTRSRKRGEPVYFADAVHPQYNTRAAYGWIPVAEDWPVAGTSGRKRLHLHGAVNAENPSAMVVLTAERNNAASAIALFERLEQQHPDSRLHVICDNASYYRSKDGRVWKYLRHMVINTTYYATFELFREAVLGFFIKIAEHQDALRRLLTPNFHIEPSLAI